MAFRKSVIFLHRQRRCVFQFAPNFLRWQPAKESEKEIRVRHMRIGGRTIGIQLDRFLRLTHFTTRFSQWIFGSG